MINKSDCLSKKGKYSYQDDEIDTNFIKNNNRVKCILIDRKKLEKNSKIIKNEYDIIYENQAGILYKKG